MSNNKAIIYQLFPRLFTNTNATNAFNGTIEQNGCGKMNNISESVLESLKDLGATHIWYTGVIEHATKTDYSKYGIAPPNKHVVKGNAGSPYAIRDYYDIDPDIAEDVPHRMQEFEKLVKRTHAKGLKVIIDFVPNHVAREYKSDAKPDSVEDLGASDNNNLFFSPSNNFFYITGKEFSPSINLGKGKDRYCEFPAKATGNDCFNEHPGEFDWYETVKLNYGVDPWNGCHHFSPMPSTWKKMCEILLFWVSKGVDGFRCDMAHMVPVDFWHWAIAKVKEANPTVTFIAELYDVGIYHNYINYGGFDYLYDKVNLYDRLCQIVKYEAPASSLTECWQRIDGLQDHMLNFMENHDEKRVASPHLFGDPELAFPAILVSATIGKSPFMVYQAQELGEDAAGAIGFSGDDGRTSIFDYCSIPSLVRWYNQGNCGLQKLNNTERKVRAFYKKVLRLCNSEKAISNGAFFDLMYVNHQNVNTDRQYLYLRHYEKETLLIATNFSSIDVSVYVDIPEHAFDFLKIQSGTYFMKELISGKQKTVKFSPNCKFELHIPAHYGVVWKIVE